MNSRPAYAVLTRFGIIAAVLASLMFIASAASAQVSSVCSAPDNGGMSCTYAENGEDPVARFTATDPEGDAITWKIDGAKGIDNDDFEIDDDGVLSFRKSPNYESPTDRDEEPKAAGDQGKGDNSYKVSVTANKGSAFLVTVEVTDVDEAGKVKIDQPQPQAGRALKAIDFSDPDGSVEEEVISWSSGASATGPWTDLSTSTASYTPKAADVGNWLQVTYTYNDKFGDDKTASAVSENAVEAKTLANAAPSFPTEDDETDAAEGNANTDKQDGKLATSPFVRSLAENKDSGTAVGEPIAATDADNDILLYSISAGADKDCFSIDDRSGQVKSAKKLNFEGTTVQCSGTAVRTPPDSTYPNAYLIVVTATDPSGAATDAHVRINVTNLNEVPVFDDDSKKLTTVYIVENTTSNTEVYKEKANAIEDHDGDGTDAPETDDGTDVTYTATDNDGTSVDTITYILEGADKDKFEIDTSGGLTKKTDTAVDFEDKSSYSLSVVARSRRTADGVNTDKYARVSVTVEVVNRDDDGTVTLSQREPQVGKSLSASVEDPDGDVTNVAWQWYRLFSNTFPQEPPTGNDDKCASTSTTDCWIDKATSASYTPTADDHAVDGDGVGTKWLAARATYNDKFNAGDSKEMIAGVSDAQVEESDPANTAPVFGDQDRNVPGVQDESVTREVAENTGAEKKVGIQGFTADDADGDLLLYTLGGADGASFQLSDTARLGNDVDLQTKAALDYETKNEYTLTVTATDPSGASDTISVTVNVTDKNEGATIDEIETVKYAENGTDPVATLSATDPEGDDITWKIEGAKGFDNADFEIDEDSGALSFKKSPNYEKATDRDEEPEASGPQGVGDNSYKVSVTANGGSALVLTVEVTDVDEAGTVKIDQPQPQAGRTLNATGFSDPDGGVEEEVISWSSGASATGPWTDLGVATKSYMPKAADVGNWLQVTYTYNDKFGDDKTASAVSENAVESRTLANAAPSFPKEDDVTTALEGNDNTDKQDGKATNPFVRSLKEEKASGTAVGEPVDATDADNDVLLYTISGGADKDCFSIDARTGQVKSAKKLSFEATTAQCSGTAVRTPPDSTYPNAYVITVTATDPSSAATEVTVRINVTDVNEPPVINEAGKKLTTVYIAENTTGSTAVHKNNKAEDIADDNTTADVNEEDDGNDAVYTATDDDGTANDTITYELEGADAAKFAITGGVLTKVSTVNDVDFEEKSSYSVTVVAKSTRGTGDDEVVKYDKVAVTVKVVDKDDNGTVTLSQREPQVGKSLSADAVDPDGDITNVAWQWYRVAEATDTAAEVTADISTADAKVDSNNDNAVFLCEQDDSGSAVDVPCRLAKGTSASYTPTSNDVDDNLVAQATYNDKFNPVTGNTTEKVAGVSNATVQAVNPANTAPVFGDQDRNVPGDQTESVTREVAENTAAKKRVGIEGFTATDADEDLLMYELGGADADSFQLSDPDRAGNTVDLLTKAELDYETKSSYAVTVTATDPSGASDSIAVTVMVTDVDDGAMIRPVPVVNSTPVFPDTVSRSVGENMPSGTNVGDPVTATDENVSDTLTYSMGESMYFTIDAATGQITTTAVLDYETMASHTVTVTADDGNEENNTASVDVTIMVDNAQSGCNTLGNAGLINDCEALLDSEEAFGGTLNWDAGTAIEDWDGVSVQGDEGMERVTKLNLKAQNLHGTIPATLNNLTALTSLNLHTNNLSGTIPDLSGTALTKLYLSNNELTGKVPTWLNGMTDMVDLWLWGNELDGVIPDLSGMTSMDSLKLAGNNLTGGIPEASALPPNVRILILQDNQLGGTIPDLSSLSNLKELWLHSNGLTGEVPASLNSLTNLTSLNLRNNDLTGDLPDLSGLDMLRILRLQRNQLSGEIPGTLGGADSLQKLYLHGNQFTGIGAGLADAADTLTVLWLKDNSFATGTCLMGGLADVAGNDFADAGLAACPAPAPTTNGGNGGS